MLEFPRAAADLVEQTRVLDGDGRVMGEGQCQFGVPFRVEARLRLIQVEQTNDPFLYHQRHAQPAVDILAVGRTPPASGPTLCLE